MPTTLLNSVKFAYVMVIRMPVLKKSTRITPFVILVMTFEWVS